MNHRDVDSLMLAHWWETFRILMIQGKVWAPAGGAKLKRKNRGGGDQGGGMRKENKRVMGRKRDLTFIPRGMPAFFVSCSAIVSTWHTETILPAQEP